MKNRFLALVLAFTFLIPVNVVANTQVSDISQEDFYIPLRDAFESNEGKVDWLQAENKVVASTGYSNYTYENEEDFFYSNGSKIDLTYPLKNINGTMKIHYDDIKFLYEEENEMYPETKKSIVTTVYKQLEDFSIPSVTLSFVDSKEDYSWEQGFGKADIESSLPVSPETMYSIGSISKTFTALTIMKLIEEGHFTLDTKVVDIIPEFSMKTNPVYGGNSNDVTIEMLLSHYSGINGDLFSNFYTYYSYEKDYMNNFINTNNGDYMSAIPGKRMSYSNVAYGYLGAIIAQFSGDQEVFDGYSNKVKEIVIEPLELENTRITPISVDNVASSYNTSETGIVLPLYVNNISAGGMFSSAQDMSKIMTMLLNKGAYEGKQIFSSASIENLMTPVDYEDPLNNALNMALGTYEVGYNGVSYTGHGGDIEYFHSDFALSTETGHGIFASANSASSAGIVSMFTILNLEVAIKESGRTPKAELPIISNFETTTKPLEEYIGHYIQLGQATMTEDRNIEFSPSGLVFENNGEDVFTSSGLEVEYTFKTVDNIDIIVMNQDTIITQRVDIGFVDDEFLSLVGKYEPVIGNREKSIYAGLELVDSDGTMNMAIKISSVQGEIKSLLPLVRIDSITYAVTGIGRNLSTVIEILVIEDSVYIKYNGMLYEKQ